MLRIFLAVLYTASLFGANAARAEDLTALQVGEMRKMVLAEAPVPLPDAVFLDADDGEHALADWRGRWLVLNFWATWCAPCRAEMPSLERLQAAMPDLAVLPVASGRNAVEGIARFYDEAGIKSLPVLRDPKAGLARQLGVMGLPVTLIVDPEGREVARLIGDAAWDSPEAKAMLTALMQ